MPFPPKKPGIGVIIGLKGPGPLDRKPGFPPKRPSPVPDAPAPADRHHEQGEENGDFGMIGEKFGLSPEDSKAFAYDVLEACMKMTGGAAHEQQEPPDMEESPDESGGEAAEYGQ